MCGYWDWIGILEQSKLGQVDDYSYVGFKLLPLVNISNFDVLSFNPIIADTTDIDWFQTFNLMISDP